ncbi:polysaccharide biosynthesis protein [Halobacillus litoralis]|uniref:putative polysaccharide biosynthesis protein n=1 Tax=Halobacillus litoralis TaxID=45668 RepID=UPI001CFC9C2B|nr:polysaccharide biosynthesis protein [Halobacillus litoralis]
MTKTQSRSILKGAFILSFAGLISKIISAGYRVPLQNLTGDIGFYVYQQVYPILGIALILSLYGFPAAISKLVSEEKENRISLSIPSFYLPVFGWMMLACSVIFLLGYTQSPFIAQMMGDESLIPSLKASFYAFLLIPFVSVFRGVFQGESEMAPTAVSQIIEQVFRVAVILFTSLIVMRGGDVYIVGIGAAAGAMCGAVAACLFLFTRIRKSSLWSLARWNEKPSYGKPIFVYGLFICLNYMLLLSLQLVDAFTLVPLMIESGESTHTARITKGIFDRGQPLIQLGTVLASSLALAIIPSVTRKRLEKDEERTQKSILSAIKITGFISFGATTGLIFLFPSINEAFFQDIEGTGYLRVFMLVILGSSLSITTSSILQGLGYVKYTALVVGGGLLIKAAGNQVLIPLLGVYGAAVASIVAVAFVLIGNIVILRKEVPIQRWVSLPWLPLGYSLLGMLLGLYVCSRVFQTLFVLNDRLSLFIYTLALTGIGAFIYIALLLKRGGLTEEEVAVLPSSKWLGKFLPKGMNR